MGQALCKAHADKNSLSPFTRLRNRNSANPQRHGDILDCRKLGQEVMKLVDKADLEIPNFGSPGLAGSTQRLAINPDLSRAGLIQPTQELKQRGLARTRRAHDGKGLTEP
jgi:hypothetical protein